MTRQGKSGMFGLLAGITVFAGLLIGAYFLMIAICPPCEKPGPEGIDPRSMGDLENRLRTHVFALAEEIGERNLAVPLHLNKAADYIQKYWRGNGYEVAAQSYPVRGIECKNLSVEIIGSVLPNEIVLVGAHYDSVIGSPGANDNGTAVAALLEISRLFDHQPCRRTIRFVGFPNEEPPFFHDDWMGSRVYARACRERGDNIVGMLSLETIGYYSEMANSQHYPAPLGLFYPETGNFLAVVGNLRSRRLVKMFTKYFREGMDFSIECVATFSFIPGISWSDHSSFWKYGYPAIMITDTALYRYPYYHTDEDTPDKINYPALSKVTHGTYRAVRSLADGN